MRYAPGSTPIWTASLLDENLEPVTPDTITVDIIDSNGLTVVNNGVPTEIVEGSWQFTGYQIPLDAPTGLWKIEWTVILNGDVSFGEEEFEVVLGGIIVNPDFLTLYGPLRSRIGEVSKLPADQNGSDTLFLTSEIAEILALHGGQLNNATLEGWERKTAKLQHLIDFHESGSERNLSRKFIQAKQMLDHWTRIVSADAVSRQSALAGRVVGQVASLRDCLPSAPIRTGFSGLYERYYLTHRLIIPVTWS